MARSRVGPLMYVRYEPVSSFIGSLVSSSIRAHPPVLRVPVETFLHIATEKRAGVQDMSQA